jgi:hypothetical protein
VNIAYILDRNIERDLLIIDCIKQKRIALPLWNSASNARRRLQCPQYPDGKNSYDDDDNVMLSIYVLNSLVSFAIAFIVIKNIIHDASELIIDAS